MKTIESSELLDGGVEKLNQTDAADCLGLPLNCHPLSHQVAGHFFGKGKTKIGLLQTGDGLVLKPVQSPPRGEREHNFFKHRSSHFVQHSICISLESIKLKVNFKCLPKMTRAHLAVLTRASDG